ncbi:MAG: SMP-30/gluconolactonase/LRE family protein, partial [Roseibacillus sp.]|nr:SMP-30/gluconolactonase/LRE family protein [Roseibacillus sp.]
MKHTLPLVFALSLTLAIQSWADLTKIVPPDVRVEKLGGGMKFTEGPVWIPSRKMVVFSDIPNSVLMQWTRGGGLK